MAAYAANKAATSLVTAADWDTRVNTPTVHASSVRTVSAAGISSAGFTAPNLVNAVTRAIVKFASIGTAGTLTAQLQVSGVDVAGCSATINITDLVANSDVHFEFTTPGTYSSLTANAYTLKLFTTGASGTTTVAQDSAGTNYAFAVFDDRHTAPAAGDDIWIIGINQTTPVVCTVDGSTSFGSGTDTAVPAFRSWTIALNLANQGKFALNKVTSYTTTCKGSVFLGAGGGEFEAGTEADPIPRGVEAKFLFDQNAITTNYGFGHVNTGKITACSEQYDLFESVIVSGVGTAASPLVLTDATGWAIGDELVFPPISDSATNYDESETRFIIGISGTDITLSTTAGGAEAALTYDHVGAPAINVTQPAVVATTDITKAWYADFNETTLSTNVKLNGIRLETLGSSVANRNSITFSTLATELCELDNVVFYRITGAQGVFLGNNRDSRTYTNLIAYDCNATGNAGAFLLISVQNKRFENCRAIDSQSAGFFVSTASTCEFEDCRAWACGRQSATAQGGWQFTNALNNTMNDCESHANRSYGTQFSSSAKTVFAGFLCGTKGTNGTADIMAASATFQDVMFEDCMFGSATLISNYLNMNDGSEIAFHRLNQVVGNHRWYSAYGYALRNTTDYRVDSDSACLEIRPESATGFIWEFDTLVRVDDIANVTGWIKKNATFGTDDIVVDLYLPGLVPGVDSPSATYTMPDDAIYNPFNVSATFAGTVPLLCKVRITAKSATSGAYCFVDDIFGGGNIVTALDVWEKGKPVRFLYPELGNPGDIWNYPTSGMTASGTAGYLLTKLLTVAKFIGLK